MDHPKELLPCFEQARRIHRRHGKSYYFATQLFPRDIRLATYALYAFFRIPDELVDNPEQDAQEDRSAARRRLAQWRSRWEAAYDSGDSDDPILRVTAYVFHRYRIPCAYSLAFLDAMEQDVTQATYTDYDQLLGYMYGSAGVVGLMMSHVIGFEQPQRALPCAEKLGYAMQLTNFLRDIDEDYLLRHRVYMPLDEMDAFGLSVEDIASRRFSAAFRQFMEFQAQRTERLYAEAEEGIPLLKAQGRLPVQVASVLYHAILTKLAGQDWNVFQGRASTSLPEKIWLAVRAARSDYAG